ncbi:MAG: hypothetical protein A2288_01990 [Candidatus Moranbacteria bacterium RIFOXYA12_FULL_44_15]|nr:MAG: hypothetical protein A2288_01990 [Candidatus Moranbacteria bacterium RIFOXYA12_FULL_44_15]OGI35452.1 MAG: hypothetical protein A2259_02385 [Candidatus Moranbacteria bacterium RIFOXYA2_FULL_43_15]
MLFNVPQFIDIEDKIVGPLTAKQLGWLGLAGVILLVLWNFLDTQAMIIAAVVIGGIFGALAFYRPYNQTLLQFIFSSVLFATRPKIYIWRRFYDSMRVEKKSKEKIEVVREKKKLNKEKIEEISKMLNQ